MDTSQIDLYDFLTESELQHYYNAVKNELKITNAAQFKYASDEDLKHVGMSRPEIRRLRKFYEKHFPHGYLSKIKRLLQAPTTMVKREGNDSGSTMMNSSMHGVPETPSISSRSTNSPSKAPNNKHIIPADSITVNKQLGTGEFGIVQQGVWTNGTERIQVAIKCLSRERMQSNPMEFLKEAVIMHSIEHENIVRLYGVVLATDSLMLVTELAHLRSLLECLKDSGLRISFLTIPTLCEFAMQICNGMQYLENKRLIHRDLAARNILVFSKDKVKISDFGLSRALGVGKDYYKTNFNVNLKLPIAWCAPECINYLRFTNASDVWAYGVCLWEMFSYGFQPWAALTGLQILEAIDAPNYQRLEQPDCCPREYYTLMLKCWQDDPAKRPKFSEIYDILPDMKPEQLKAVVHNLEPKKEHLLYRQGDIITVLDRNTGTPFWKGVLYTGKVGFFNPSNTVAYLEGLPSSNRDSFCRVSERNSKRKLKTEMISKPQNDLKHTGHVGIDGASFGDIAFLGNPQTYNHVPQQIVTPYKPSEDIEQTPLLLPPTPTSPDSLQTASGYFPEEGPGTSMNPSFISSTENTPKEFARQPLFEFPGHNASKMPTDTSGSTNPFAPSDNVELNGSAFSLQNNNYGIKNQNVHVDNERRSHEEASWRKLPKNDSEEQHEYHEISDDEITVDKLDFGPSLLDEINSMFGSMSYSSIQQKGSEIVPGSKKNDFLEISSKLSNKCNTGDSNGNKFGLSSSKKKGSGTVKPISVKDEKILNQAIEIANEISARSMNDLVSDQTTSIQSPKRKFSFRFPHLTGVTSNEKPHSGGSPTGGNASGSNGAQVKSVSPYSKKKNFTEELESIPDLQAIIGEDEREAYNILIERKSAIGSMNLSPASSLFRQFQSSEFDVAAAKTLPRRSVHLQDPRVVQRQASTQRDNGHQIEVPLQNAPRPMTLPTRGAAERLRKIESMGLGSREQHDDSFQMACNDTLPPCESPSYLVNTSYNFPEKSTASADFPKNDTDSTNPIPLPPREGKKHIKTNAKRHVRKYPLIIPASGVQRTLNKVTEQTTAEEAPKAATTMERSNSEKTPLKTVKYELVSSIRHNANSGGQNSSHLYQNVGKVENEVACTDSASLQFESIMEADSNKGNVLQSPDVTDGFYNFSIQKDHYNKSKTIDFEQNQMSDLYVNEDELRNLDIKQNLNIQTAPPDSIVALKSESLLAKCVNEQSKHVGNAVESELAGNSLFKKFRESVNLAMDNTLPKVSTSSVAQPDGQGTPGTKTGQTEAEYFAAATARLMGSNSVSCEDLLEFSAKKPKGSERGVDSDEVRIMMKVLGADIIDATRCLQTLEFINWDVHKSIKAIKLQNILPQLNLNLSETVDALQKNEWDLHATALKLKTLKK